MTKIPGLYLRGKVFYARFWTNGKLIQKKLSRDRETAVRMLEIMRIKREGGGLWMQCPKCQAEFLQELDASLHFIPVYAIERRGTKSHLLRYKCPVSGQQKTINTSCSKHLAEEFRNHLEVILNDDVSKFEERLRKLRTYISRKTSEERHGFKRADAALRVQQTLKKLG